MTQGMRVKPVYSSSPSQTGDDSINAPGIKSIKYPMVRPFTSALFSQRNYQPLSYRNYSVLPVLSVKVITLPDGNNPAVEIDITDQQVQQFALPHSSIGQSQNQSCVTLPLFAGLMVESLLRLTYQCLNVPPVMVRWQRPRLSQLQL